MSRLMRAFRTTNKIDPDRESYLMFDGERLELDSTVVDNGLEDMDIIEVHFV